MMKRRFVCILMCALLLLSCTAVAEQTAIAPEVVPGRIMGYVINNEGAEVYEDIYSAEATMEPVKTYEYGTEIEIQKLGLGYCRVRSDDSKVLFVRTRDLSFSNEPFGSQLAIVFVKRSKVLPLHKTDSAKSKRVTDVPDGSYVVVLEKGATFSHVLYGKYEGYLQNAYLSFREAWPDDVQQAILRNPDQPKRHMTINLRSADSLNGKKVTCYRRGEPEEEHNETGGHHLQHHQPGPYVEPHPSGACHFPASLMSLIVAPGTERSIPFSFGSFRISERSIFCPGPGGEGTSEGAGEGEGGVGGRVGVGVGVGVGERVGVEV